MAQGSPYCYNLASCLTLEKILNGLACVVLHILWNKKMTTLASQYSLYFLTVVALYFTWDGFYLLSGNSKVSSGLIWFKKHMGTMITYIIIAFFGAGLASGYWWSIQRIFTNQGVLEKPKVVAGSKIKKTKPDATSSFQDRLLFIEAGKEGNVSAIESLLDKGVDVNTIDKDGRTVLIWAIIHNQKACVQKLIEKGCNVNAKTNDGNTAFTFASIKGYDEIVDILKKAGADSIKY